MADVSDVASSSSAASLVDTKTAAAAPSSSSSTAVVAKPAAPKTVNGKPHKLLTKALIMENTGEDDVEVVEDIEIIFNLVHELADLDACYNLRTLTLISTQLRSISNLACVGHSLEKLSLVNQQLTKIENLYLPNLRELYLQKNRIKRLEGFEGCPKLRRLWIFSNDIRVIENLHCLGDLRELWLQDNQIRTVGAGLDCLMVLGELNLAANHIADFKDLQKLAHLPALRDLALEDDHFGRCPIVKAEGYRNFVLCALKQVRVLDGAEIAGRDRSAAEDKYMQKVLEFNDRIDALRRENERELLAIEARRRRNASNSESLRQELLTAFAELESVVTAGRAKVREEHARQRHVREANLAALERALDKIKGEYGREVDRLVALEHQAMAREERGFRRAVRRAAAERDQASFLARLMHGP